MVKLTVAYVVCYRRVLTTDELLETCKGTLTSQTFLSEDEWTILHMPNSIPVEQEHKIRNRLWYQNIDKMFDRIKPEDMVGLIEKLIQKMELKLP